MPGQRSKVRLQKSLKGFTAYLKNDKPTTIIVTEMLRGRKEAALGSFLQSRNEEQSTSSIERCSSGRGVFSAYAQAPPPGQNGGTYTDKMTLKVQILEGPEEPLSMCCSTKADKMLALGGTYFKKSLSVSI